jgi:hypothetical protein
VSARVCKGFQVGLLLAWCACARNPEAALPRGVDRNTILSEEIVAGNFRNAYEVVERLRPNMFRQRALTLRNNAGSTMATSAQQAQVPVVAYLDDARVGGADQLKTIPAAQIREIRYVNAQEASMRWGTGHASGAIVVYTRR